MIDGLSGIFPRMLCGNVYNEDKLNGVESLLGANEVQFTHTNFDYSLS